MKTLKGERICRICERKSAAGLITESIYGKTVACVRNFRRCAFFAELSAEGKKKNNNRNAVSRALYIIQYLLLAAFEGAVLDAAGLLSSVLAAQRERPFVKRHLRLYITAVNIFVILCGAAVYKNPCSILPAIGVLCHTGALWIKKERIIRLLSLAGSPFWLAYNIICHAMAPL